MVAVNGRSDEFVVRLTMEDILAHLHLLPGQKDAWYYKQVNLENWACASFCTLTECMFSGSGCVYCCP